MESAKLVPRDRDLTYLAQHGASVLADRSVSEVYDFFNSTSIEFAAVVGDGRVVGICGRNQVRSLVAGRYGFALYSRTIIRDHLLPGALLVNSTTPLRTLLEQTLSRSGDSFYEDVALIDAEGGLVGLVSTQQLVQAQSDLIRSQFDLLEEQRRNLESSNHELARSLALQRDLERQMVAKEKAALIETLASGIAHELNNKLMPIVGYSELLLEEPAVAENRVLDDSCRTIHRAALDSSRIIRQLLQMSRPSATERSVCDLRELVEQALVLVNLRLREDDVELSLTFPNEPVSIHADSSQVRQVVTNLVLNAMDAMKTSAQRELGIAIRTESGHAVLQVSDTGTGIPDPLLSQIFDPFFTTKGPNKGTGLGLSVSQSIIRAHGGEISVRSSVGIGTVFFVRFAPAAVVSFDTVEPAPTSAVARFEHAEVLVVDDDDAVAGVVARTLSAKLGCRVSRAADGETARVRLGSAAIDAIVSDVRMPGMGGAMLLEWIKTARPDLLPRVVFMTGDADHSAMNAEIQQAGVPLLKKPLTGDDLVRHVRALLHHSSVS